jgi:hypothetical protein
MMYEYGGPQWNDTDRENEELGEEPVSVPLCPLQIPHGLTQAEPGPPGDSPFEPWHGFNL